MQVRISVLLLYSLFIWSNAKHQKINSCNDFCCQSVEAAQICESMRRFFRHGREGNQVVNVDADCKRCLDEHSPHEDWTPTEVGEFVKASNLAVCQSLGRCKAKMTGSILGDERCSWGPKYWCSSMENAARCRSFPHCGQEWIGQRLANAKCDRQCLTCQKTLSSIHFRGNALDSIRNRCVGPECSPLTQHLIELITLRNLSHGGVSPAILCHKLGMCEGTPVERSSDPNECQWAHAVWIGTRQLFAQGFTDYEELLDLSLAECDKEELVSDCRQAVCHFLPAFFSRYQDELRGEDSYDGHEACEYVLACSSATNVTGVLCQKCEDFVTGMRIRAICRVKKVFNFIIAQVCHLLGPLEKKCIISASDLKGALISVIEVALNTRTLCSPFCRKEALSNVEFSAAPVAAEAAKRICGEDIPCQRATTPLVNAVFEWLGGDHAAVTLQDQSFCQACKSLSEEDLKVVMWEAGNSLMEIERLLPEMCYLEPKEQQDGCLALMGRYGQQIARILVKLEPSGSYGSMCDLLGVCQLEERCMMCEEIADRLSFLITNTTNVTEEAVVWALNQTCQNATKRSECEEFTDDFAKTITALLVKRHVRIPVLCRVMGVCLEQRRPITFPLTCDICRFAVLAVERALARNLSREQIIDWVQHECEVLPRSYRQACGRIVHDNLPRILQLLAFIVKPDLVCFELGLCSALDDMCPIGSMNVSDDYRLCTVCQMGVITARAWLRTNEIVPKLLSFAEKACRAVFSKERANDCVDAANSVCRLLNHWLVEGDPLQMCRWLRFCPEQVMKNA